MMQDNDVQQLYEIKTTLENLRFQVAHLVSTVESEKGTLQREADRLRHEIDILDKKFNDWLFKPETGVLIQIDRLIQESERRKKMQTQIIGLWVAVGIGALKMVVDFIIHK